MGGKTGGKLIGLIRVSTGQQGESGLGLEAQEASIVAYAGRSGSTLLKVYREVESGGHDDLADRPELLKALAHARCTGATLVIAKLDRLLRSTVAHSALKVANVRFVALDNESANELTLDILVAVAADERRKIGERTRSALSALKARGVPLGASRPESRNLDDASRSRGVRAAAVSHKARADAAYADLMPVVTQLRADGLSHRMIADRLNEEGHVTRRGKPWNGVQVGRVLDRVNA
jgi:DNA invertase Pin-like site-specific DNA recombinase